MRIAQLNRLITRQPAIKRGLVRLVACFPALDMYLRRRMHRDHHQPPVLLMEAARLPEEAAAIYRRLNERKAGRRA
ncbi:MULTISPECIES: hypothetical protein [unclassified Lysobacter]|uniref:hypothetical protein n=1 Tax=unclassified Lysobacter TaxID=2635362 RepID=UPI001C22A0E7|nr:hypothetical protein [Lysobacter sp. MMG2]MBU8975475.1 hypothetical protein [Lysobacter sp. MMG2]